MFLPLNIPNPIIIVFIVPTLTQSHLPNTINTRHWQSIKLISLHLTERRMISHTLTIKIVLSLYHGCFHQILNGVPLQNAISSIVVVIVSVHGFTATHINALLKVLRMLLRKEVHSSIGGFEHAWTAK